MHNLVEGRLATLCVACCRFLHEGSFGKGFRKVMQHASHFIQPAVAKLIL